jgi:hypothetical protein
MQLFGRRNEGAEPASPTLLTEGTRVSWAGVHEAVPYARYWISINSSFQREYGNTTHELFIGLVLNESTGSGFTASEKRVLFRRQSDYRLPGLDPCRVSKMIAIGLIRFLLANPHPRRVKGLYDLPPVREVPIWEHEHERLYLGILQRQLKINNISVSSYKADPAFYLNLMPGDWDAPRDTNS